MTAPDTHRLDGGRQRARAIGGARSFSPGYSRFVSAGEADPAGDRRRAAAARRGLAAASDVVEHVHFAPPQIDSREAQDLRMVERAL